MDNPTDVEPEVVLARSVRSQAGVAPSLTDPEVLRQVHAVLTWRGSVRHEEPAAA